MREMVEREFEGIVRKVQWQGEEYMAIFAERDAEQAQLFWPVTRAHPVFDELEGKKVKVVIEKVAVS